MDGKDGAAAMLKTVIDELRCKGCALCTIACPRGLVHMDEQINRSGYLPARIHDEDQQKCTSCALCARMCPDLAIRVYRPKKDT